MNEIKLSKQLHAEALSLGLCDKWSSEWSDSDSQKVLIERYKKGLDFSIKNNWPSPEFIKEHFDADALHACNVWSNEEFDVQDGQNGIYVVNGRSKGTMVFSGYAFATVYVRHESDVKIEAKDHAIVILRLHDVSNVETECGEESKIRIVDRRS